MFGDPRKLSEAELKALNTIAKFKAKHGKGKMLRETEQDFYGTTPGRPYDNVYYKSNKPGSKRVLLDVIQY